MTSVVIVNYNGSEITAQCLNSLQRFSAGVPMEIILIDNGSSDGSLQWLQREFRHLRIVSLDVNRGFGYANNAGAETASGECLLFLNNDTEVTTDIITPMENFMASNETVGVVGPRLLNTDGSFQLSYGKLPSLLNECYVRYWQRQSAIGEYFKYENVKARDIEWVTGAAMMIRRSVFERVGGFDPRFFMYFEDADLCLRVRKAGYQVYWLPEISLIHHRGKSRLSAPNRILEEYRKSQLYYYGKHRPRVEKLLLKIYLIMKFLPVWMKKETRDIGFGMLKIALDS